MEELFDGVPRFQVVDESPDRDPSSHEHRGAAEDLGVAVHYLIGSHDLLSSRRAKFTRAAQVVGAPPPRPGLKPGARNGCPYRTERSEIGLNPRSLPPKGQPF